MPAKHSAALILPRQINPELVEVGDTIEVELPKQAGMTITRKGVVSALGKNGNVRQLLTSEAGILCAWEPGKPNRVTVTLIKRAPVVQQQMFDFTQAMDEIRERIA